MDSLPDIDHKDAEDLKQFLANPSGEKARQAAARLLDRHREQVYLWCFRLVRNHDLALDLTQDVLLSAFQKLPGYVHRARFTSWLFIIARNRCLSEVRKPALSSVLDIDPDELHSLEPEPGHRLDEQDLWKMLERHLDREELDALHLRCVEGMPVETITEVMAIKAASGARGVLQRARRKLRAALEDQGGWQQGLVP